MSSDWPCVSASELIDKGRLVIGDGYRAKNREMGDSGLPFARASNVDGAIRLEGADLLLPDSVLSAREKVSRPGDAVFTSKGTVGRFAYVRPGTQPFVYSPQLCFWRASDGLASRFLFYWLQGPEASAQFSYLKAQTDMADYVSLGDQRRMRLTLPPLDEQRRIAGVLGALDDKIEHDQQLARHLSDLVSIMFRQLLLGPCESAPLGDQVGVTMGQSPPGASYSGDPTGVPLVQGMASFGERFPSTEVFTSAPTKRTRPGDVLMTVRAPVGEINVADGEYCAGRGVAIVRGPYPAYTEQLLRFLEPHWREHESGTIYPSVNRAQIVSMPAPRPAIEAIEAFESRAGPAYDLLGALSRERAHLSAARDALLPKLVSGAIRVLEGYYPDDAFGTVADTAGVAAS